MANIYRYRVSWTGLAGLPGVSTFYFGSPVDPAPDLHTMFAAIATHFPTGLSWSFPVQGDTLNDGTGQLVGNWTSAGAATIAPSGGTNYTAAAGALIRWTTNTFIAGRHVIGKTFLVPLVSGQYDNGTILDTAVTAFQSAVNTWHATSAGTAQVVWNRPRTGVPGGQSAVTGAVCPDKVAVLRSRRD